ncbi:Ehd1 [Symbiodinium microadriaticum]|nr:Ehd1 [Symbiodinium microadriaticum]
MFHKFHAPEILPSELGAKPQVLLLGQYSTGKTSFIRNLLGSDYPGIHIGPEPTTDKFIAVAHGEESKVIKGNSLTAVNDLPYAGLSVFGGGFLNKFEAALCNSPVLKDITIIDTPGVLSGEKQRLSRGYDFAQVSRWFAERSDLILLLFDSYKLDISDEFKGVIENLRNHDDKVHCVMNKADQLDPEALMKVYGALLWSMGKIFHSAEVPRVYCGSFREEGLVRTEFEKLFEKDKAALMAHLQELPRMCGMRKVNEMVKRIRLNIVHVCVIGHLKSKMPLLWGFEAAQKKLLDNLDEVYREVRYAYNLSDGDFPPVNEFRATLQLQEFRKFPNSDRATLSVLKELLSTDIPIIFKSIAGVSSDKKNGDEGEDDVANKSLQAVMNFDFNATDGAEGNVNMALAFVAALLVLLVAIVAAIVYDNGESLGVFIRKLKGLE